MTILKENPTLKDIQEYTKKMEVERGFDSDGVLEKCILLGEEVGELFKAIRKEQGIVTDNGSHIGKLGHEMADILFVLTTIANRCGVDIETALREKEEISKKRKWS